MDFESWSYNKQILYTEGLLKYQQVFKGKESMKKRTKKREGEWNNQKGGRRKKKKKTQTGIDLEDN